MNSSPLNDFLERIALAPKGPDSFIWTYKIVQCPQAFGNPCHPPMRSMSPLRESWICHWIGTLTPVNPPISSGLGIAQGSPGDVTLLGWMGPLALFLVQFLFFQKRLWQIVIFYKIRTKLDSQRDLFTIITIHVTVSCKHKWLNVTLLIQLYYSL